MSVRTVGGSRQLRKRNAGERNSYRNTRKEEMKRALKHTWADGWLFILFVWIVWCSGFWWRELPGWIIMLINEVKGWFV